MTARRITLEITEPQLDALIGATVVCMAGDTGDLDAMGFNTAGKRRALANAQDRLFAARAEDARR